MSLVVLLLLLLLLRLYRTEFVFHDGGTGENDDGSSGDRCRFPLPNDKALRQLLLLAMIGVRNKKLCASSLLGDSDTPSMMMTHDTSNKRSSLVLMRRRWRRRLNNAPL